MKSILNSRVFFILHTSKSEIHVILQVRKQPPKLKPQRCRPFFEYLFSFHLCVLIYIYARIGRCILPI